MSVNKTQEKKCSERLKLEFDSVWTGQCIKLSGIEDINNSFPFATAIWIDAKIGI